MMDKSMTGRLRQAIERTYNDLPEGAVLLSEDNCIIFNKLCICRVKTVKEWEDMFVFGIEMAPMNEERPVSNKNFRFRYTGSSIIYLERFLLTAFPDVEKYTVGNVIDKEFIGAIQYNKGYENIIAICPCYDEDSCDEDYLELVDE